MADLVAGVRCRLVEEPRRYTVVCDRCGELAVELNAREAVDLADAHRCVEGA